MQMSRRVGISGLAAVSALLLAGGAYAGVAHAATPAANPASNPYSPAYGHSYRHGVVPTRSQYEKMQNWARKVHAAKRQSLLKYGGGVNGVGVTTGAEKVYLVFWGSQWGTQGTNSSGYVTLSGDPNNAAPYLQGLIKGLGTNGELWSGVPTQYCQGVATGATNCPSTNTEHVAYPTGGALAGVWVDESSAAPQDATVTQLADEAIAAAAHFGNTSSTANRDAQYVIVSPTGTNPDGFNTSTGNFCAWHDYTSSSYGDLAYTNMPYVTDAGTSCGEDFVNGSNGLLDGFSIVEGHEYAETITDQFPSGGWTDSRGSEIGDKCAWISPGTTGGAFDLTTSTGTYAMQTLWANDDNNGTGGCEASHPIVTNP
jgi:hypothetical protein